MKTTQATKTTRRTARVRLVACAVLVVAAGCAPKQRIPVAVGPEPVDLFVNGLRVEPVPSELVLRADRDHKVFVKRPGFRPELVVLETREQAGAQALTPARVDVTLSPRPSGRREVEIEEVEDTPGEGAPAP